MDLFGLDQNGNRFIVAFTNVKGKYETHYLTKPDKKDLGELREVAHVVLDLNHDYLADLCLSTSKGT